MDIETTVHTDRTEAGISTVAVAPTVTMDITGITGAMVVRT